MTSDLFNANTPTAILTAYASADAVKGFLAWRKATKKPLTERAAKMVAKTLAEIKAAGGCPDEALDTAVERGWTTIKSEWFWRTQSNDQSNRMAGRGSNANTTVDQIHDAARIRRSQEPPLF